MNAREMIEHLNAKFSSGNGVPVTSSLMTLEDYRLLVECLAPLMDTEKDAARYRHILEHDISDLFQYGGDPDEISNGIDIQILAHRIFGNAS